MTGRIVVRYLRYFVEVRTVSIKALLFVEGIVRV